MKKNLYIHIGRPKVGSSAIQHFLNGNRFGLAYAGCFYAASGYMHKANHGLAYVLYPDSVRIPEFKGVSAEKMYADLIDELQKKPEIPNAFISSENFYFVDPKKLHLYLDDAFDVKIVCYVRRQDDVLVSSYIQELKDNLLSPDETLADFATSERRLKWLDYDAVLKKWSKVFGKENIMVRPFESEQFFGESIYSDILHVLNIDSLKGFEIPRVRVNPSPSRDVLNIILHINNRRDVEASAKPRLIEALLNASEYLPKSSAFAAGSLFDLEQRNAFLSRFNRSNANVAEKYLARGDGKLFLRTPGDDTANGSSTDTGFEVDRLVSIFSNVLLSQQDQVNKLETRLDELTTQLERLAIGKDLMV